MIESLTPPIQSSQKIKIEIMNRPSLALKIQLFLSLQVLQQISEQSYQAEQSYQGGLVRRVSSWQFSVWWVVGFPSCFADDTLAFADFIRAIGSTWDVFFGFFKLCLRSNLTYQKVHSSPFVRFLIFSIGHTSLVVQLFVFLLHIWVFP